MNVLEAIYARKSIRKFKDEIVPREDILKMLEIANSGILGELKGAEGKFCYSFDEDEMDE